MVEPSPNPKSLPQERSDSPLGSLLLFNDLPRFGTEEPFDENQDAFNHEAFADGILQVIKRNAPPLSIGLFGAWGIGKSTVINILFKKIREKESKILKPIYFNAWKYSGDSFRRQFLIDVAKEIYGTEHEKVKRLEQLNYTDVLKQSRQKAIGEAVIQGITDAFATKLSFRGSAIARFIIGCASVLVAVAIGALISVWNGYVAAVALATAVPAIFLWFSNIKFEELFVFQEAPLYAPKLIFQSSSRRSLEH